MPSWTVRATRGRLDLIGPGLPQVRLLGLVPEVAYRRSGKPRTWRPMLQAAAHGFEARSANVPLSLQLSVEERGNAVILRTRLRNQGSEAIDITRVSPVMLDAPGECVVGSGVDRWSVLRQGYQSWTGTRSFRVDEVDRDPWSMLLKIGLIDLRRQSPQRPGHWRSDMFSVVKNLGSGEVLLAGFLTCSSAFGDIEVCVERQRCTRLAASLDYDETPLAPGEEIDTEPLWLAAGSSEHELLADYAAAAGAAMHCRVPARSPIGWCSWYHYFTHITEDEVLRNLAALQRLRSRFPCDYVQVDDGYQAEIGDWLTTNKKFPHGMAWLGERIRAAGFDAGLWTAPFMARTGSQLLADHPDWFVRDDRDEPRFALWNPLWGWFGSCYALDTTHPQVLDWLRQTFRTIAQEWGYGVLKLDFLFAAALPGQRYDRHATRAAALRRGLEAIREGAGDEAFLLGCGCPFGPAIGIVDAMRIGPDVAPFWSNLMSRGPQRGLHGLATKHAIRNTLTRAFLHRKWWLNDPDCLMVRKTDTQLSADEVRSLATVIAVTDGMIVLSDCVEHLPEDRLALLERTLAASGGRAQVVDLLRADLPELVVSRNRERTLVAIFNFADEPRRKQLDLPALGIIAGADCVDWWCGVRVPIRDGKAELGEIPAHGCRVLQFAPENQP